MANKNTRRRAKERAKEITAEHVAGRKVTPEPSRRMSKWHPAGKRW
jgi:hypothetical protein